MNASDADASGSRAMADGATKRRRIAIFGTSADPPTGQGGHAGIVQWALLHGGVEEVWVVPVYSHMFDSKSLHASFSDRVRMCELAFLPLGGNAQRVKVLTVEEELAYLEGAAAPCGQRVGTIDVVRSLVAKHPETEFVLVLGEDALFDLKHGRWKEGEALLRLVEVRHVPRRSHGSPPYAADEHKLSDISSTQIRKAIQAWMTDGDVDAEALVRRALHPAVLAYILEHRLYGVSATSAR